MPASALLLIVVPVDTPNRRTECTTERFDSALKGELLYKVVVEKRGLEDTWW